jgi:hypothetical protein
MAKLLPHEKLLKDYFDKLPLSDEKSPNAEHLLSEKEKKALQNLRWQTLFLAGLFGGLGVVLLYLPYHLFGHIFWIVKADLPWLGLTELPVGFTVYGIALAIVEIFALTFLNLHTVRKMANICGFAQPDDRDFRRQNEVLFEVGLEKPADKLLTFGIDPFEGLSKTKLLIFNTLVALKATLSNMFVKIVVSRILTRFAIRANLADYVGVPIFAFWNIYATNRVIYEAKIRILAPNLIAQLNRHLYSELSDNEEFKEVLFDILKFIAIAKRDFHHNHYLLVESMIKTFKIQVEKRKNLNQIDLVQKIQQLSPEVKEGLAKLFIFGILIDGRLSNQELRVLEGLAQESKLIKFDSQMLKKWENSFINGNGLENLYKTKISQA